MRQLIIMVFASALLLGCSESKPPEKTVFDPQVQAVKKAREVEKQVLDAGQKQRENIERETK